MKMKNLKSLFYFFSIFLLFISCSNNTAILKNPNPDYVVAHSDGMVSRYSSIDVILVNKIDIDLKDCNPFTFEPSIKGKVEWNAEQNKISFIPLNPLTINECYKVNFDFAKIGQAEASSFDFNVKVREPGLSVVPGICYVNTNGELELSGTVTTTDIPSNASVESLLDAKAGNKKLEIVWTHEEQGHHDFIIKKIPQVKKDGEVILSWDGKKIGSKEKGQEKVKIPSADSFEIISVSIANKESQSIKVSFSKTLDKNQDLRGLIHAVGMKDIRYEVEGGLVTLYSNEKAWPENTQILVEKGVRSSTLDSIAIPVSTTVKIPWKIPSINFPKSGTIVPSTQGTKIVLETVNLAKVYVEALLIKGDRILQFLQVNDLDEDMEMNRVGEVVWNKEFDLSWNDGNKNIQVMNELDLSPLLAKYPDGMFQIRVGFCHDYIKYESPDGSTGKQYKFPPVLINEDVEYNYWDDKDYDWNEYYQNRDNPNHPAFYIYNGRRVIYKNVLVSNVGIIAKKDVDNNYHIVVSDLRSAKPIQNAKVSMYSYAQNEIVSKTTDKDGMVIISSQNNNSNKPYFIVSEASIDGRKEKSYLKLIPSQTLSVSHFDVGGQESETGLKGFIYGERGVWRPGDDMHLTFILDDRLNKLPENHPVSFEFFDPMGTLVKTDTILENVNGFYYLKLNTDSNAPTGNWTLKIKVGGKTFYKNIKVETIIPNRLTMSLDFDGKEYVDSNNKKYNLSAKWLHGALASKLKADVTVSYQVQDTVFSSFPEYSFVNLLSQTPSEINTIFDDYLDENGKASFDTKLRNYNLPGVMKLNFVTRVFESSGAFSTESQTADYYPYDRYVGIKAPEDDKSREMLFTDKDHNIEIVLVDKDGKIVKTNSSIDVKVSKLTWRWWLEKGTNDLAEYENNDYMQTVKTEKVKLNRGKGNFTLKINNPDWGWYLITAKDTNGHSTGKTVYIDWPNSVGRGQNEDGGGAQMLSLSTDKEKYNVGDKVIVTYPTNQEAASFVTIERSGKIIYEGWTKTEKDKTVFEFVATKDMAPNVYVHVSLIQAHMQTANDLPIRLYGIVPIMVEDPETILNPVVSVPNEIEPNSVTRVSVSESNGKAMTYTLAVVEEGLLGITKYKTTNPWNVFYQKESSELSSYDIYKDVVGAYSGKLQTLLSIGGGDFELDNADKKISRFPAVVKYFGPISLNANEKKTHDVELGTYTGSVRFMLVAGNEKGAYGSVEKSVAVKTDLLSYTTAPRFMSPGEIIKIPVTVFSSMGRNKKATVAMTVSGNARLTSEKTATLIFEKDGEKNAYFEILVGNKEESVSIDVSVSARNEKTSKEHLDIPVRSAMVSISKVTDKTIEKSKTENVTLTLPGIDGTNEAFLELSSMPLIDLSSRLSYLLQYPHGCCEQTVSKAFPQLFLEDAMNLEDEQIAQARNNIIYTIDLLPSFQNSNGSFALWRNQKDDDPWLSCYVTHFLLMAKGKGYTVPDTMLNRVLAYLSSSASSWSSDLDSGKATQAYRLYILAKAGKTDIAALNRFSEFSIPPLAAQYHIAAALYLSGMKDYANAIVKNAGLQVVQYKEMYRTYGSVLRDEAIILDALNTMGNEVMGASMYNKIAKKLSKEEYYSTQDLSFSLLACLPYMKEAKTGSQNVSYTYNGNTKDLTIEQAMVRIPLSVNEGNITVSVSNKSTIPVFARLVASGKPKSGTETQISNNMRLAVSYLDENQNEIDISKVPIGQDVFVNIQLENLKSYEDIHNIALSYKVPTGFEIENLRLLDNSQAETKLDYQDIRDDCVLSYFDLYSSAKAEPKVISIHLTKAYEGTFVYPAIIAEAMYDPSSMAVLPALEVSKTKIVPQENPNSYLEY